MKGTNFQDNIPSISIVIFKEHYVPVIDLTSMQDATENCQYPELVGKPLRLELIFTFHLENVNELLQLGERRSSVAVDPFGSFGKNLKNAYCFNPANNQLYPNTQVLVPLFFSL